MLFTTPYERLTPDRLPWLSFGLASLWGLALLAARVWPELAGALPLAPGDPRAAALAGHWLLHESWAHLATGLLLLLLVGPVLEEAWGRLFYGGFQAAVVLCTSGAYVFSQAGSERPLVGASGLVAGLLAACIARQLRDGIHYTAVGWWRGLQHRRFWIPAYALVAVWFAGEVLMQAVDDGRGATRGVGYAGPAIGALLGAITARVLLRFDLEERWLGRKPLSDPHPALEAAERAFESSGADAALQILRPAVELAPKDPALVAALCRAARGSGKPEMARGPFAERIRTLMLEGQGSEAADLWVGWAKSLSRPSLEPRLSVQLAGALAAGGHGLEAARLLRPLLDAPERLSTGLALRIVEQVRPVHAGLAIRAARLALESGDFPEPERERLEALVRELELRRTEELDPQLDDGAGGDLELARPDPAAEAIVAVGLEQAAAEPRFSDAKCAEVVPVAWEGARLELRRGDSASAWIEIAEVQAIATGAVRGMAPRPVILIDLLLNWSVRDEVPLHFLRIRSDRFDPTTLLPGAGPGLDGFRALLGGLIEQSGGAPLPDAQRAEGRPFATFDSLEAYERRVLLLER
jgi:membrane associated rhomboid family serine protease